MVRAVLLVISILALAHCGGHRDTRSEHATVESGSTLEPRVVIAADAPALATIEHAGSIAVERPCFPDGACFRIHAPRALRAIDAAGGLVVEVGEHGAAVETVGGVRTVVPAFTDFDLRDVWVRDRVEAWAVGDRIYRRSARGWTAIDCGLPQQQFVAVHGDHASGRVVAITSRSLVRVDDGRCEVAEIDAWLEDVWVEPGGRRTWATGGGRVLWADGPPEVEGTEGGRFVAGRAPDDVWIGGGAFTLHFDGHAWRRVDAPDLSSVRIEPALVDGEPVVIAADGSLRDARVWRSGATVAQYLSAWELALDVAVHGARWIAEVGTVHTTPEASVEGHWVGEPGHDGEIAALVSTSDALWVANEVLHRVDGAGIRSWDPFRHFFWGREQCQLARVTGVVDDGEGGVFAAAQARVGCPAVASLLRLDDEPARREEWPLPAPIRRLVRLPGGGVLGIALDVEEPAVIIDRRGRVRRMRLPRTARERAYDRDLVPFRASACATADAAWIVDDRFRLFRIDPRATRAVRVDLAAGADSVTCEPDAAWAIGCNGRLARCEGRRCVELAEPGEAFGEPCGDPLYDDSPLEGTGPFHPLARDPAGRFFTAVGSRIYVREATGSPWQDFDAHDDVADVAFRDGHLVVLARNGNLTEYPLAALPLGAGRADR